MTSGGREMWLSRSDNPDCDGSGHARRDGNAHLPKETRAKSTWQQLEAARLQTATGDQFVLGLYL
jgi:hypothetical protein